jgi:DNA processing protein
MDPKIQWVGLSLSRHIGTKTLASLLEHFDNNLNAIFDADEEDLMEIPGIGEVIAREIMLIDLEQVARDIPDWEKQGVGIITPLDDLYPQPLLEIPDFPPTLFVRGQWYKDLWHKTTAIVGTRRPSQQAKFLTMQLAAKLAQDEITIVSGLALGIDAAAHAGALQAKGGGNTIAVLGSGVLNIYPPQNKRLSMMTRQSGALISEVNPNISTNAQRLVSRNRIISGMSQGVIVIESDADGGAMHAAKRAKEQGRTVYTLDLPATGNQQLIREGAIIIPRDLSVDFMMG